MIKDIMKELDGDIITMINLIISPLLYMSVLLPLVQFFGVSPMVFPITMIIHNLLYWSLVIYFDKKR